MLVVLWWCQFQDVGDKICWRLFNVKNRSSKSVNNILKLAPTSVSNIDKASEESFGWAPLIGLVWHAPFERKTIQLSNLFRTKSNESNLRKWTYWMVDECSWLISWIGLKWNRIEQNRFDRIKMRLSRFEKPSFFSENEEIKHQNMR